MTGEETASLGSSTCKDRGKKKSSDHFYDVPIRHRRRDKTKDHQPSLYLE